MSDTEIKPPFKPLRHARLFELVRQQSHALDVEKTASEPVQDDAVMAAFIQRAAASWKIS